MAYPHPRVSLHLPRLFSFFRLAEVTCSGHYDVRTQCLADLATLFGAMTLSITGELVRSSYMSGFVAFDSTDVDIAPGRCPVSADQVSQA